MILVAPWALPAPIFLDASFQTVWYLYTAVYFCQLRGLSHLHPFPRRRLQLHQPRAGEWHQKEKKQRKLQHLSQLNINRRSAGVCCAFVRSCFCLSLGGEAPRRALGDGGCDGAGGDVAQVSGATRCLSSGVWFGLEHVVLELRWQVKVELIRNWPKYLDSTDMVESFPRIFCRAFIL